MLTDSIDTILKDFNLRNTKCREEVLDLFLEKNNALSNADIEDKVSKTFDRVTIYRTLKTFLSKGLIHKVLDDVGNPKYALCKDYCTKDQHKHQHVHFKCTQCSRTYCLENIQIPSFALPKGYSFVESNLLITGICIDCNKA